MLYGTNKASKRGLEGLFGWKISKEDNFKMDYKGTGCEVVNWINLVQD